MGASLDFSNFTFSAEEIRAVNELIWDDIIHAPEITLTCTLFPGIVFDKKIGFIGEGGLVGVKRQDCNPIPQPWKINTRQLKWEPRAWEVLLEECFADLESTAAVYSLNTGRDIADFTNTDYMAIVTESLSRSMKKFIIRLFWFNDMGAEYVADGGRITQDVGLQYFNILDGFWKQLFVILTNPANSNQRVTIAENAGATYAAQRLSPANVQGYLQKLVFDAPILLQGYEDAFIVCTKSFYNAYAMSLQGKELESMFTNMVNGIKTLTYNGIPLIAMPIWDEIIKLYENTGVKLMDPHRALYVTKDILACGLDGDDSFEKIETWYNKDTRSVKTEAMGKADAKIMRDDLFMLAI